MNRAEAKSRLTQLRKEIDVIDNALIDLLDTYMAGELTDQEVTESENGLKENRAILDTEFRQISDLPCCNI